MQLFKMKKLIFIFTILILANISFAQNDGPANTGLSFLKDGAGARALAMGNAYSMLASDALGVFYNPALMNCGDNNVSLSHNISMIDYTTTAAAVKYRFGKFGIGLGLLKSGVSDIEVRTTPGAVLDKFDSQNLSVNLAMSYQIYKNISFGVTPKLLYEKIYTDEASGFGFDIGTSYIQENINFSFVIANLGSMNEMNVERTKLPSLVRFGGAYNYKMKNFDLLFALEGNKVLDGGIFHIHSGIEAGYKNFLFLRAGFMSGYETKNFTAGLGLRYKGIMLDYSFIPYSDALGTGNTFTLGYNF
jgi:hypothetical protein